MIEEEEAKQKFFFTLFFSIYIWKCIVVVHACILINTFQCKGAWAINREIYSFFVLSLSHTHTQTYIYDVNQISSLDKMNIYIFI